MHENLGLSRSYMCLKHHENNLLCDAVASSLHGLSLTLRLSVWERESKRDGRRAERDRPPNAATRKLRRTDPGPKLWNIGSVYHLIFPSSVNPPPCMLVILSHPV